MECISSFQKPGKINIKGCLSTEKELTWVKKVVKMKMVFFYLLETINGKNFQKFSLQHLTPPTAACLSEQPMQHRYRPRPARTSYKSSSYKDMFERVPPLTVADREKWRCRQCGKEVSNPWHHSHTHRQERFYCPQCGNSYNRIDSLKAHYRSAHTGPGAALHPGLQAGPQHLPPLPLPHAAAAHGAPPNHNSH
ncbi:hypothetical protein FOCC_FOCC005591 [Frankliniella occidentalis]|nr:hypothetical protein FOCC_FOCC005591 [Frankliniella occidentalis]